MTLNSNPLCLPLLKMLKEATQHLRIHELMTQLGDDAFPEMVCLDLQLKLFRKNFYLMNALYQLQVKLEKESVCLIVSALDIHIQNNHENAQCLSQNNQTVTQAADNKLRDYYLDWSNYDATSKEDVDDLLNTFWLSYREYHQQLPALDILGLKQNASWIDIQQSYRRLIQLHHPDKGGDSLKFMEIREAYEALKVIYDE